MKTVYKVKAPSKLTLACSMGLLLMGTASASFAESIVVKPNTVITHDTTYDHVTLDMQKGSFIIQNKAVLTIKDSTLTGTLSPKIPTLWTFRMGRLTLITMMSKSRPKILPHILSPNPYKI